MNIQCTTKTRETYPGKIDAKIYLMTGLTVNFSMGAEGFPAVQQAVVEFGPQRLKAARAQAKRLAALIECTELFSMP